MIEKYAVFKAIFAYRRRIYCLGSYLKHSKIEIFGYKLPTKKPPLGWLFA